MNEWWQLRSARERTLLRVMAGLALLVLGWLLVVRPLADSLAGAKARHAAAVVALAEATGRHEALRRDDGAARVPLPIDSLIAGSAGEAGFRGGGVAGRARRGRR